MRQAIIHRYATERLPRYTSYPTASHFDTRVDSTVYARWLGQLDPGAPVSLYLHVPFCRTMCWYCGCHTKATRRIEPMREGFVSSIAFTVGPLSALKGRSA